MMTRMRITRGAVEYFKATEYYIGADCERQHPSRYRGGGAKELGLDGPVDMDVFAQLIEGRAPDGTALVRNAGDEKRRMGWDLTFSQEKSISILFSDPTTSPAMRDALLEVHRHAVDEALSHLESLLEVRKGKGGVERVTGVGMTAALIDHFASRDLDCQMHTHAVVCNMGMTMDEQGKPQWQALSGEVLAQYEHAIGAVFRASSAAGMQRLGFKVDMHRDLDAKGRETGKVFWRVSGVDEATYNASSKRAQEIEAYMLAHPGVGRQQANLATRKDKEEPSFGQLMEQWKTERETLRASNPHAYKSTKELMGPDIVSNLEQHQPKSDDEILFECTRNSAFFKRADLLKHVAQEYVGRLDMKAVVAKTNTILEDLSITRYFGRDKHQQHRYSTVDLIKTEAGIAAAARARKDDVQVRLTPEQVQAGLDAYNNSATFKLSDEQEAGVRWICGETGGVAALTGFAGAGKTSSFLATKMTLEMAGKDLIGTSTSWKAANKLSSETGIDSVSSVSLLRKLDSGKLKLHENSVVVYDEAGMAGSRTIAALQKHVDAAGAKLVLMGDCLQLQPVEAGAGFRLALEETGDAKLTEIRRQKTARARETAGMFYGLDSGGKPSGAQIFDRLMDDGHVKVSETEAEAKQKLVEAYLADPKPIDQKLVLAGTRSEVMDLNLALREGLQTTGVIDKKDHKVRLIVDGQWRDLQIAKGERLAFSEKSDELGVVNGDGGIVTSIEPNPDGKGHRIGLTLVSKIETKNGRDLVVDTSVCPDLTYNLAMTTHKSQGQGVDSVYALYGEGGAMLLDNQLALVSFTRCKEKYTAFGSKEVVLGHEDDMGVTRDGIADKLGWVNLKETTQDGHQVTDLPTLSKVSWFEGQLTLDEKLQAIKANAMARAANQEKEALAKRAAMIVAQDRQAMIDAGEASALAAQQSQFMRALPGIQRRREEVRLALIEAQNRERDQLREKEQEEQRQPRYTATPAVRRTRTITLGGRGGPQQETER